MKQVRKLTDLDAAEVVERIARRLRDEASWCEFVNPELSRELLEESLRGAKDSTWVAVVDARVVGHLYGAVLESETYGRCAWVGPDGVSFDAPDLLADLYATAGQSWLDAGARDHYVWVLDQTRVCEPWYELGFARVHARGVLRLVRRRSDFLPDGYRIRRGGLDDLDLCVELVREIDRVERHGPSFSADPPSSSLRDELVETLSDPDANYFVVDYRGEPVGQCLTFAMDPRRGSFARSVHLSAVVMLEQHQRRGVATSLIDVALRDARNCGFAYAETNWRVTNRRAATFWKDYGFHPTYVRLQRTLGSR